MKYDTDIIIIGAGPAGCAAAYDLVSKNRNVLIIDKSIFPRAKACAGGLTIKSLKALRYSVNPVIRHYCNNLLVSKKSSKNKLLRSNVPIIAMTVRSEFDNYCLDRTLKKGARFKKISSLIKINEKDNGIELETDLGILKSKFIIGADGVNSRVRKLLNLFSGLEKGFAIEATTPLTYNDIKEMEFDFGVVPFGYGWIFPKDDHINIGLYTSKYQQNIKKINLKTYVKKKLNSSIIENIRGQYIALGGWKYKQRSKNAFLIGDAAGLTDPLLGEGIYNAIKSGQLVANAIEKEISIGDSAKNIYGRDLTSIKKDILSSHKSAFWFYNNLIFGFYALTFPAIRYSLMKGFSMGLTFSQVKKQFYSIILKKQFK